MSRLTPLVLDEMTPEQRAVADEIIADPRRRISGPFIPWLRNPEMADLAQKLGFVMRFRTTLPPRLSELAILVAARFWRSDFAWTAHLQPAAEAGVAAETIQAIAAGQLPTPAAADEATLLAFCNELLDQRAVSDLTYEATVGILGERGVVELVALLGYYTLAAMTMQAFEIRPPEELARLQPDRAAE
jgi:4-carboxymuconolactone decarboxylase